MSDFEFIGVLLLIGAASGGGVLAWNLRSGRRKHRSHHSRRVKRRKRREHSSHGGTR